MTVMHTDVPLKHDMFLWTERAKQVSCTDVREELDDKGRLITRAFCK